MITYLNTDDNTYTQKDYDKFLNSISIHNLPCTCNVSGHFIKHGYYRRYIKTPLKKVPLLILRVKCKHCGKTHAVFPTCIVPYSQHLLKDQLTIIQSYQKNISLVPFMESNLCIDEANIATIIKRFKLHWKERLISINTSLFSDIRNLVINCFTSYRKQFMQIKRGFNLHVL